MYNLIGHPRICGHLFFLIFALSAGSFAEDTAWLDLDGKHLRCTEDQDFYDFYFHAEASRPVSVDGWAHDWRNGYQNQYLMAPLKISTSEFSNRCQIGAVIRLFDQDAAREFVFEHLITDLCAYPRTSMSYIVDSSGQMTQIKCAWR